MATISVTVRALGRHARGIDHVCVPLVTLAFDGAGYFLFLFLECGLKRFNHALSLQHLPASFEWVPQMAKLRRHGQIG